MAKAVKAKKVRMASHEQAEQLTGLQTGGISALALINKGFEVYLDNQAQQFTEIAVSAGQRGANILLPLKDLIRATRARPGPVARLNQTLANSFKTTPESFLS